MPLTVRVVVSPETAPLPAVWQKAESDIVGWLMARGVREILHEDGRLVVQGRGLDVYWRVHPDVLSEVQRAARVAFEEFQKSRPGHPDERPCRCRQETIAVAVHAAHPYFDTDRRMLRALHSYLDQRS